MQNRLFRKEALDRLMSPEALDQLMKVTSPRSWVALLGLMVLLAAVVLWGVFGEVPITVEGEGILIRGGGINSIASPVAGQISDMYIEVGDSINEGDVIARILDPSSGENVRVISTFTGRVLEIRFAAGNPVEIGTPLISIEPRGRQIKDLEAVLYLSPTDGKRIRPGMEVQLAPRTVRAEEVGYMLGRVISVGEFPESEQSMLRVLSSPDLVRQFLGEVAPVEVRVDLIPSADTISGYRWSTPQGPDSQIQSGTLASAIIQIDQQRPVELVFPRLFSVISSPFRHF